jgi:hypothetical protein
MERETREHTGLFQKVSHDFVSAIIRHIKYSNVRALDRQNQHNQE